jgi:TIGR03009 family protein
MFGPFSTGTRLVLAALLLGGIPAAAQQIVPQNENVQTPAAATIDPATTAAAPQIVPSQEIPPTAPDWAAKITAKEQQYIEQLLDYWQSSSQQIRQCTCDFTRWAYDPEFCNFRNPQTNELCAFAVWRGEIKYAAPDKAFFETSEAWQFELNASQQPDLKKSESDALKLQWVCDGHYIYEYDYADKILRDMKIPEEYEGEGLINSPLPFLFGAERQTMLDRYWIRVITPATATDEYWLEAVPKRIEDARNYSRVHVVIARQDFLPRSIIIFPRDYDPLTRPASEAYLFENRRINSNLDKLKDFLGIFVRPAKPAGWKREEVQTYGEGAVTAQREEMLRKQ